MTKLIMMKEWKYNQMVKVLEINIAGLDPNNMNNSQSRVIEVESWRTYTNYYRN